MEGNTQRKQKPDGQRSQIVLGGDEEVGLFLPTGTLMIRRLAHQGHPESSTGLKPVAPLDRPQFRRQASVLNWEQISAQTDCW